MGKTGKQRWETGKVENSKGKEKKREKRQKRVKRKRRKLNGMAKEGSRKAG